MATSNTDKILSSIFTTDSSNAIALLVYLTDEADSNIAKLPEAQQAWLKQISFSVEPGNAAVVPGDEGPVAIAVVDEEPLESLASLVSKLPVATYHLVEFPHAMDSMAMKLAALGWGMDQYRFEHYLSAPRQEYRQLVLDSETHDRIEKVLRSFYLVRDLINTPAENMGPSELSYRMQELAAEFHASMEEIKGEELEKNYPAIWTVGRASDDEPRLLHFTWGDKKHPKVALVGKGVCFDSGGLDIKGAAGMRLMKKDMGGAAHVLGLARAIMAFELPIHLEVYVSAVENSIAGNAFRPGDIIKTRKGLTVEVGNTDAEGRLVLSDAMTLACESKPDLLIDFATLTGAARVALGSDLPAMFCNNDELANQISANGERLGDPVWRMPLHQPYNRFIKPAIADLANMSSSGLGGAITAALFLEHFVEAGIDWCHFDVMGYSPSSRPAHPEGGDVFALMAVFHTLKDRFCA